MTGASAAVKFTRYQVAVVAILAFLQFTVVLDFAILSPLGAMLMHDLAVVPAQFGLVSCRRYRFQRVHLGTARGRLRRQVGPQEAPCSSSTRASSSARCSAASRHRTASCWARARSRVSSVGSSGPRSAWRSSPTFFPSRSARARRDGVRDDGFFAGSQVLGIPLGLYISSAWGWHAPFLMIAAVSAVVAS